MMLLQQLKFLVSEMSSSDSDPDDESVCSICLSSRRVDSKTELWTRVPLFVCDEKSKRTEDAKLHSVHAIHNIVRKKLSYCNV